MNYQHPTQRSRIPKVASPNGKGPSRCRSCLSPSSSPDISYSTALPLNRRNRMPTALGIDAGESTLGQASLEAVKDMGHCGATENASVPRPWVSIEVGTEEQVHDLNNTRVVSSNGGYTLLPSPARVDDDGLFYPRLFQDFNRVINYDLQVKRFIHLISQPSWPTRTSLLCTLVLGSSIA